MDIFGSYLGPGESESLGLKTGVCFPTSLQEWDSDLMGWWPREGQCSDGVVAQGRTVFWWGGGPGSGKKSILYCMEGLKSSGSTSL